MYKKPWLVTCTITAYICAFVLPDLTPRALGAQAVTIHSGIDVAELLGIKAPPGHRARTANQPSGGPDSTMAAGLAQKMNTRSALSAAVMTTVGGRGTQFSDLTVLGDWDGREDLVADRAAKIDDFSTVEVDIDQMLTRSAISEHTVANGFNENVYYYGDSVGNVWVGVDTNPTSIDSRVDTVIQINLPTVMNAFGTLLSDDQVVVTGLCVNPVVDTTSWSLVNGSFAPFSGQVGEALIVTYTDTGGGSRTTGDEIVRSGVLAFPIIDAVSPAVAPPGVLSDVGFPVTVGGGFGVAFSTFSNIAGCAVDDDGSIYFQQVDLQQFTGGNIVKISRVGLNQDRSVATNGFIFMNSLNPPLGVYGIASGPVPQQNRFTNYSGTSTTFGNVVSLAAGPGNTLYAALAGSSDGTAATGLFANTDIGATPSMIVSFADVLGTYTFPGPGGLTFTDGIADVAGPGLTLVPGGNNYRAFALGAGPDVRSSPGAYSPAFGTTANTLKLDFQIDYSIYSGITVDEARQVYVISGGTPAGIGRDPSPTRGEILLFPDKAPGDRRADYVDLRGNQIPRPPASGGNTGDGDSDRFDHMFLTAPIDPTSFTATGLSGLTRGFLRYTNRLAPNAISPGSVLGLSDRTQTDNGSDLIFFGALDPGHQVSGGDGQTSPLLGDDRGTGGNPPLPAGFPPSGDPGTLYGGFEFTMSGVFGGLCTAPWNAFILNANGNITFGNGDGTPSGTSSGLLSGSPRIAAAWRDWVPSTRVGGGAILTTFPLQAVGFAGVNEFKIRWINMPSSTVVTRGLSTFSISLFDDGTASDENAVGQQEGPTDNRFLKSGSSILAAPLRPDGSAPFTLEYGTMDSPTSIGVVLVGYSVGNQLPGSVSETDLSEVGRTAPVGNGTATAVFEAFASSDFDLRSEGNDASLTTPGGQPDLSREIVDMFGSTCAVVQVLLTAGVTGSGDVTGPGINCPSTDCSETLSFGIIAVLTATPTAGFAFQSWAGCDNPSGNVCNQPMNHYKLVIAQFSPAAPLPIVPTQPLQANLNQASYASGQTLTLSLTLAPGAAGAGPVDAYVVLDVPGAGTYSLTALGLAGSFVPGVAPIATGFVPFAFEGVVLSIPLPATLPAGTYQWRTFLTQSGTANIIGAVDSTPFTFTP